jgi:hypothetical protein
MIPFAAWYEAQFAPRPHMLDGRPFRSGSLRRSRKRQRAEAAASARASGAHYLRAPSASGSGC